MPFSALWMDLENTIVSEMYTVFSEMSEKDIYDITYVWNPKNNTNEYIYKTEQTQKHIKQTYGYQRGKRGRQG